MDRKDCVRHGAAHLDAVKPSWAAEIDLERLDMGRSCFCILGQLYNNYGSPASIEALRLEDFDSGFVLKAEALGFSLGFANLGDDAMRVRAYEELQALWVPEIQKRRTA